MSITRWQIKLLLWFLMHFKRSSRSVEVGLLLPYDRCRSEEHAKVRRNVSYLFWFESGTYQTSSALFGSLIKQGSNSILLTKNPLNNFLSLFFLKLFIVKFSSRLDRPAVRYESQFSYGKQKYDRLSLISRTLFPVSINI